MPSVERQPGVSDLVRQNAPRARTARAVSTPSDVALRLQRTAGNRSAARVLARWTKHPDDKKKGIMVPDSVASELMHFNPPQNA